MSDRNRPRDPGMEAEGTIRPAPQTAGPAPAFEAPVEEVEEGRPSAPGGAGTGPAPTRSRARGSTAAVDSTVVAGDEGAASGAPTNTATVAAADLPLSLGRERGLGGEGRLDSVLVTLDDISVVFETRKGFFRSGKVRALDGVGLAIGERETVALVGESGSGKTTLGRVSLRLIKPAGGRVIFDGRDITSAKEEDLSWFRKRAQIVFQDPFSSLNPYMKIGTLIEEPLVIDGGYGPSERAARVRTALEAVELVPAARFAERYPTMMSGGQRQRVGIARALVRDPDYVVADEPVSMIDASSRIEILDLLRTLQTTRGLAFLYITHDIASARHFADRIAVMYLGTVVERAAAGRVIDNPLHPYTKALIEAIPEPDPANRFRRRAVVPGEQTSGGTPPVGCPFFARCPDRTPGLCDVQRPVLKGVEPGHFVACHLYEAGAASMRRPEAAD